jgi:hypothetical protein
MKSTHDPEQLINAYLQDGLDELPERSFNAVRTAIDQTRQWAVIGPWKEPQIMTLTRFALVAAAIAVVAVLAFKFLPSATLPTPAHTAPAATTPVTTTSPSLATSAPAIVAPTIDPLPGITDPQIQAVHMPWIAAALVPNVYSIDDLSVAPLEVHINVPEGWSSLGDVLRLVGSSSATTPSPSHAAASIGTYRLAAVANDACHPGGNSTTVESAADVLAAVTDQRPHLARAAESVLISDLPTHVLEIAIPATLDLSDCTDGALRIFDDETRDRSLKAYPGDVVDVYVVDLAGIVNGDGYADALVVATTHSSDAAANDVAQLDSMLQSITLR